MNISFESILIIIILAGFYVCLEGYLFFRSLSRVITEKTGKKLMLWVYWPVAVLGLFLFFYLRFSSGGLRSLFGLVSSCWGFFIFIPFFILADIVSLGAFLRRASLAFRFYIRAAVLVLALGTVSLGILSARYAKITDYAVTVEKPLPQNRLKVVMLSDIHIGSMVHKKQLAGLVSKINSLEGDIVLIAGDIIDRNLDAFRSENLGEELSAINAPLGVFAVPGNHDYFGGNLAELEKELRAAGVKLLVDEAVLLDNSFYLIGRNDFSAGRRGLTRSPLKELIAGVDASLPIILMDHQPVNLGETEEAGIDLQVSGHTHRGQIWPGSIMTKRIYENHYGLLYKGKTAVVVSSGSGTWGPPLRIGTRSEIVRIVLANPL